MTGIQTEQQRGERMFRAKRRIALAMIVTGAAVAVPAWVSADGSFTCPNGTYEGLAFDYDPAVEVVDVGNWPVVWVGVGLTDGSHRIYGDGVTFMNNAVLPVFADTGLRATDAHLCKVDVSSTTTTVPATTTTVPATTTTVPATTTTAGGSATTVSPVLPQTGNNSSNTVAVLGTLLMLMGGVLVVGSRRPS